MSDELDRLAEAFVMADVEDREALRALRARLETLRSTLPPGARSLELLVRMGRAFDRLIENTDPDPEGSWHALERDLNALQDLSSGEAPGAGDGESARLAPREFEADIYSGFVVEAREHLDAAEAQLLILESDPGKVEAVHTVFRAFHTIKGAASCLDLVSFQSLAHETESLLELARRGALRISGAAMELVFEAVDAMKRLVSGVEVLLQSGTPPAADPGLDDLVVRLRDQVRAAGGTDESGGSSVVFAAEIPAPPGAGAPRSGESAAPGVSVKEPVRVDADRLDRLVNLIGELVIAESMVSQSGELRGLGSGSLLGKSVGHLDKITRELQEMGMSLRMVPVRPLFRKMARVVRDLSHKLGKPVDFHTSGEEIEIDRAIVNCVTDALVHILRNAIDHGIEGGSEQRALAGKPPVGRLHLRASHREGCIVIEVEDDGRGLDAAAIRAKAIEKGILRNGDPLSDQDALRLIFLPGFSTASVVTEVSGRGVGLDVVRTSVESLRGRIDVQSRPGQGTVFRLRLPLTLAIIDGMVLRSGGERFVVPTNSITRLVRPTAELVSTVLGRGDLLSVQDDLLPLLRLGRVLAVPGEARWTGTEVAVLVEDGGRRAALLVDEVLGQQQIVIKNLGLDLEDIPGISGGVILPDGQVGLILDIRGVLSRSDGMPGFAAEVRAGMAALDEAR